VDQRLILTVPFIGHLTSGLLFVLAAATVEVEFTEGQPEFIALVTYFVPLFAFFLIWLKNYEYGTPLLVGSTLVSAWFIVYFFFVHENPGNVAAVSSDGATVYVSAIVSMLVTCLVVAGIGLLIWYGEDDRFRSAVDRVIRPPSSR